MLVGSMAVGLMGCRTIGLYDNAVGSMAVRSMDAGPLGYRTIRLLDQWMQDRFGCWINGCLISGCCRQWL